MFERVVTAMAVCVLESQTHADARDCAGEGDGASVRVRRCCAALRAFAVRRAARWGRLLALLLAAGAVWLGVDMVMLPRADSATLPTRVVSYTVRPGDTLWAYASSITPQGGDVARTVGELMALNDLDSVLLTPGQRIIVPAE